MIIDVAATKKALKGKGLTMPGYARAHGIDPVKFPNYLNGFVKMPVEVAEQLRADSILVEVPCEA